MAEKAKSDYGRPLKSSEFQLFIQYLVQTSTHHSTLAQVSEVKKIPSVFLTGWYSIETPSVLLLQKLLLYSTQCNPDPSSKPALQSINPNVASRINPVFFNSKSSLKRFTSKAEEQNVCRQTISSQANKHRYGRHRIASKHYKRDVTAAFQTAEIHFSGKEWLHVYHCQSQPQLLVTVLTSGFSWNKYLRKKTRVTNRRKLVKWENVVQ